MESIMTKFHYFVLLLATICSTIPIDAKESSLDNSSFASLIQGINPTDLCSDFQKTNSVNQSDKVKANAESKNYSWSNIGTGIWADPVYSLVEDDSQFIVEVQVEEAIERPGVFRISCNDVDGIPFWNTLPIIHCENPQKVYIEEFESFDGTIISDLCKENGWTSFTIGYGQLSNNVITFPSDAFGIYSNGTWYMPNFPCQFSLPDPSKSSGVYFGITAFNYLPEILPMTLLTLENKQTYKDFVNSRTTDDYTYLYYSAEQALKTLQNTIYPSDLSSVTLITFTDGNDDGSLSEAPDLSWDDIAYQNHIDGLISSANVSGIQVVAYSIGLKGKDIGEYNYEMFKSNLKALATEPKNQNATEVGNIKEVENTLNSILDNLETSWMNTKVSCNINMRATGDRIRFTLDKTRDEMNNNPDNSNVWIEGVFSREDNSMNDIVYHGCSSTSGSKIVSKTVVIDGKTKYQFTFDNLKDTQDNQLNIGEINFWHATSSNPIWQPHTEFGQGSDAITEIDRKSAAIMFVMDCSSSLGDDFNELKRVINDLIDRLLPDENNNATEIVVNDSEITTEYYTLQGIKVLKPSHGIYIIKKGNTIQKAYFKQ